MDRTFSGISESPRSSAAVGAFPFLASIHRYGAGRKRRNCPWQSAPRTIPRQHPSSDQILVATGGPNGTIGNVADDAFL
jgi:hypothetical protein